MYQTEAAVSDQYLLSLQKDRVFNTSGSPYDVFHLAKYLSLCTQGTEKLGLGTALTCIMV